MKMQRDPFASRLFVWSGGGLPGLDLHLGLWSALYDMRLISSNNCGTSAGAIMAALDSSGATPAEIDRVLRNLSDSAVRDERFMWKVRFPWLDNIFNNDPIKKLLEDMLPESFLDLKKPLRVSTTRVSDGAHVTFGLGGDNPSERGYIPSLREAVLASMSISGVWPYTTIDGEDYSDGGTKANLPLPPDWRDFEEVFLLIATRPLAYKKRRSGALSRLLLNIDFYAQDQIDDVLETVKDCGNTKVFVLWPDLKIDTGAFHFRHDLIGAAYAYARQELGKVFAS